MTKLVAMTFEEASKWIASQEDRIRALEAAGNDLRASVVAAYPIELPASAAERIRRFDALFASQTETPEENPRLRPIGFCSECLMAGGAHKLRCSKAPTPAETPVRQVHSKSEYKRLTALGVECVVTEAETSAQRPGEAK